MHETDGWLPRRVRYAVDGPIVELAHLGDRPLSASFSHADLDRTEQLRQLRLDQLCMDELYDAPAPAGFIFHMSRVGSTVAADMFRALPDTAVVSEPMVIGDALLHPDCIDDQESRRRLRCLIGCFTRDLRRRYARVLFKMASWQSWHIGTFQALYPDTPCCFIHRNPIEVMVSNMDHPPMWMRRAQVRELLKKDDADPEGQFRASLRNGFGTRVDYERDVPFTDFVADVLGEICKGAASSPAPVLPVDYRELADAVTTTLAAHFGCTLGSDDRAAMRAASHRDVKQRSGDGTFRPDSSRKQAEATPRMRELADTLISPPLRRCLDRWPG